ncbi:cytochrome C assembly family protein [Rhodocyclus purpureus]|uniref:cytochrome C assembly family protein n=1 Tax=Rhodocyclus purpureus TaxID=1067 RepID=UPI0019126DCD|nr:cytochrome c biogenesis protein CcsA [Rhodocyclus purpureus]MBK5913634.1 cytochrome C biogenesis protein [Rhodocyclus purpureus]
MSDILLQTLYPIVAALLYAALAYHFWNTRWRETDKPLISLPMQPWERGAIGLALLVHGSGLYLDLFGGDGMRFSFSLALSLMLWLAVLIHLLESFHARMDGLQPMVMPLASVCAFLPLAFPEAREVSYAQSFGFRLHFMAAMLAYSLFTLSALHGLFIGFAERKLHQRAMTRGLSSLPPILTMEAILFHMIGIGFLLLSFALGSGVFFSEEIFGVPFSVDHKTVFGFAAWAIFATLLVGRHFFGWRGRLTLRWTMVGFAMLLLTYIGSRFVADVLLGRA